MSQPNSDPIAAKTISDRMNASLNPKGITAIVRRKTTTLKVVFTAAAPSQKGLVEYTRRAIGSLKLPDVKTVIVYGLRNGEKQPDWREEIELTVETVEASENEKIVVKTEATSAKNAKSFRLESKLSAKQIATVAGLAIVAIGSISLAFNTYDSIRGGNEDSRKASEGIEKSLREYNENSAVSSGITKEKYDRLTTGMSYADVQQIMGETGEELTKNELAGITTVMYSWKNADGSNMNVMFQNDSLVQKAQFGLK